MQYTEKQLQIIDVAQRLFADNGFDGTSIRDIAKEADVNIAMISYYFGSKEKLMEAIFERHSSLIKLQLETLVQDTDLSPMQKVEYLIDKYLEKYFNQQSFHKIVVREQMANKEDSTVNAILYQMKKQNQELVKKLVQEGQKKGVFKKNIDIPLMMATLVGTANQVMTTQHFYRDVNNLQDMPDNEFQKFIKKKISIHIKSIFKAILSAHEE